MPELRILGRVTSINMRKVLWTADLIGIAYETELWGMPHRDPKAPEYLALNPNGLVPVIVQEEELPVTFDFAAALKQSLENVGKAAASKPAAGAKKPPAKSEPAALVNVTLTRGCRMP